MQFVKHYLVINDFNFNPDIDTGGAFEVVEKIKENNKIKYIIDRSSSVSWKELKGNISTKTTSYWLDDSDLKKLGLSPKSYNVLPINKSHFIDDLCRFTKRMCIDKVNDCFFGEPK